MKILITGGAGFLGLHVAHTLALKNKDAKIMLLDIAPYNKKEYPSGIEFIEGDIRNRQLVSSIMNGATYVVHAAAALPLSDKENILSTNVEGTKIVLQEALKNKVKHVIYISSTAVYGIPRKHPVYETDPLIGVGPYGESKIQAEKVCQQMRKKGLSITTIRPKTFIGTHRLGVFEILFDWIHDHKKIPVLGNGTNRYQLMDVDDLAHAIYMILNAKQKKKLNDVFNIGAEKFDTIGEDLNTLFSVARRNNRQSTLLKTPAGLIKKVLYILEKLHLSPLYQWVYETADKDSFVSIDKIKKTLKWTPKFSNSDALIKSYKWYLKNYKDIKKRGEGITHTVGWKQGILGVIKKVM